jgi:hypothetical protein
MPEDLHGDSRSQRIFHRLICKRGANIVRQWKSDCERCVSTVSCRYCFAKHTRMTRMLFARFILLLPKETRQKNE